MASDERPRQKADQVRLLTEVARGTPMGTLLRNFWQPVAVSKTLAAGTARPIKVMGEDLTLYRGESGNPYLIGGRCAHRCSILHTGWVEQDELRCMYHGWKYDGTGLCTEIPAEKRPRATPIRIAGYPLHEYCGLVFAYLGDGPAPEFELPRKDALERPGAYLFTRHQVWDCNWFQQIENSLDSLHLSFVHVWGKFSRFGEEVSTAIPELSFSETSAGLRQVAVRSENSVRVSDWTFPNNNHVIAPGPRRDDPWIHLSVWAVPIDETTTMRFNIGAIHTADHALAARVAEEQHADFDPSRHRDALMLRRELPEVGAAQLLTIQDYVAVRGQGTIVDRTNENLSPSDAGVALLRNVFYRELEAVRAGSPTKRWTKLSDTPDLPIQTASRVSA